MKFTDEQGKWWEFRGEYRQVGANDYFLGKGPPPAIMFPSDTHKGYGVRAIIYPIPIVHEFGGFKFEEIGENRMPEIGEWYLCDGGPGFRKFSGRSADIYPILRRYRGD